MRSDTYQVLLIISGVIVTALFGVFVYREIFPEYKFYQDDYIALEQFRSTYTHKPPPDFKTGVKQIVMESEIKGPAAIDRCTTCHVALQIPYFSPTKIEQDINGNIILDADGRPALFPNEEYIWDKLDQKIAELRDEKVNEQLKKEGNSGEVSRRLSEASQYESLKTAHVGHYVYDVKKVLSMHPLIGKETRPFEFHPVDEYGCTSCHNGNGRGLVTDKAHGPVFEGQYEEEYEGPVPQFTEKDLENDPRFATIFNHKPGEDLIFQTTPIFVDALIQAKCMQCHQTSVNQIASLTTSATDLARNRQKKFEALQLSFEKDKQTVLSLLDLRKRIVSDGYNKTFAYLEVQKAQLNLSSQDYNHYSAQLKYLNKLASGQADEAKIDKILLQALNKDLIYFIGSSTLVTTLQEEYNQNKTDSNEFLNQFIKIHQKDSDSKGELFVKAETIDFEQDVIRHAEDAESTFNAVGQDQNVISALQTDVDALTKNFQQGQALFLSQACYACHRIAGFSRGGVGPDLTKIGDSYPWYIKQKMVWPQGDNPTSTMPNMRLDHKELQDLMTFLLAQQGADKTISKIDYQAAVKAWEGGKKNAWEKSIPSAQLHDLRYGMTVFATEGCASCHRLKGFESDVGFAIEKKEHAFDDLFTEQEWFKNLFPELVHVAQYDQQLPGSSIVAQIEMHAEDIDKRISSDVRSNSIIEEIEKKHPGAVEALYSNFQYALRAKDSYFEDLAKNEKNPDKLLKIQQDHAAWKTRVHNVLMMYVQVYGLGRLIGPRPNWSGIFRTDEWLMEHFHNPSAHVPRSIMPIMPFDDSKFLALTYMLDVLAPRNSKAVHEIWAAKGFNPEEAYTLHCSQCHGDTRGGNGSVAEWIYPIPKNLRSPDFLRNLTKERAIYSITHGVSGTPMPPWGEVAKGKSEEIQKLVHDRPVLNNAEIHSLVDWLYSSLPGAELEIPKWEYGPKNVLEELKKEGGELKSIPNTQEIEIKKEEGTLEPKQKKNVISSLDSFLKVFPDGKGYYASLIPRLYAEEPAKDSKEDSEIKEYFDIVPSPNGGPDLNEYYIQKKYYTAYNIDEGMKFFLLNCAVCHGNEGDGTGIRSSAMNEAKPRMLTNLDWAQSRDDLRLLRSIKYGVPGTAMTPWGDQTSTLQRLQLVIFIRTLTQDKVQREKMAAVLYQAFEVPKIAVDNAWGPLSKQLIDLKNEQETIKQRLNELERLTTQEQAPLQQTVDLYKRNLEITQSIDQIEKRIQLFLKLKNEIKTERDLYNNLGEQLLNNKNVTEGQLQAYSNMIRLNENIYHFKDNRLVIQENPLMNEQIRELQKKILDEINQKIAEFENQKKVESSQELSEERTKELIEIQGQLDSMNKLKIRLITDIDDALGSLEKQKETLKQIYNGLKETK